MARSIRGTFGRFRNVWKNDYADEDLKQDLLREARQRGYQIERIKRNVRQTREGAGVAVPPLDPDRVPITISDEGPLVHHAVTEEDLREVMRRLPPGVLDGLTAIRLCRRDDDPDDEDGTPDPFLGVVHWHVAPGVYAPQTRGVYHGSDQTIDLHAHVHAPDGPGELALFLKLRILVTFAHEVSHHFDRVFRTQGDRWRMDDRNKNEDYAAERARSYVTFAVLPWVRERYPTECAAFAAWMERHVGYAPHLEEFDGSGRKLSLGEYLVKSVAGDHAGGVAPGRTRARIARVLYRELGETLARTAIERGLAEHPDQIDLLAERAFIDADTNHDEPAEATFRAVLARAPDHDRALWDYGRLLRWQRRWQELAETATRGMASHAAGSERHEEWVLERAHAWLHLGRWEELDADLSQLAASTDDDMRSACAVVRTIALCRRERYAEALDVAAHLLRAGDPVALSYAAELRAVCVESAHRLGRLAEAPTLADADLAALRDIDPAWSERMAALQTSA